MGHWTSTYGSHAPIIYEVDADVYQNPALTHAELAVMDELLAQAKQHLSNFHLDLACGPGRHSIALATRGIQLLGVDSSAGFLSIAQEIAGGAKVPATFVQGDLRNLLCIRGIGQEFFGSATLLGNSFGYFSNRVNRGILKQIHRVLKPGGILVFDTTDRLEFLDNLTPYSHYVVHTKSYGKVLDERWRKWNFITSTLRCRKRHTSETLGLLLSTRYYLRLYTQEELRILLRAVGFRHITIAPYESGSEFGAMSARNFFLCIK